MANPGRSSSDGHSSITNFAPEVAGDLVDWARVVGHGLITTGHLPRAAFLRKWAPGTEPAAGGRLPGVRYLSRQQERVRGARPMADARDRADQRLRVRMSRV